MNLYRLCLPSHFVRYSYSLTTIKVNSKVHVHAKLKASSGISASSSKATVHTHTLFPNLRKNPFLSFSSTDITTWNRHDYLSSYSTMNSHHHCWKCGTKLDSETSSESTENWHPSDIFFCAAEDCGALQPSYVSRKDYFKLFGFEKDYDIDTKVLSARFKKIQQRLHPDMAVNFDEVEKKHADDQSSLVNKAYDVLLKPVPRALYLLELNGQSLEETDVHVDPVFLMDIMELNETISDLKDQDEVKRLINVNKNKINQMVKEISAAFKSGEIRSAKELIAKIKYFVNIEEKLKDKIDHS